MHNQSFRNKIFQAVAVIGCLLFSLAIFAQPDFAVQLQREIAALRVRLNDASTEQKTRWQLWGEVITLEQKLGDAYFNAGQYNEATAQFVAAENDARALHNNFRDYFAAQVESAEALLQQHARESDAQQRATLIGIGQLQLTMGLSALKQEAKLLDDDATLQKCLQRLLTLAREKNDRAAEIEVWDGLAEIALRDFDRAAAMEHYERALALRRATQSQVWQGLHNLATAHQRFGELTEALALTAQAITLLQTEIAAPNDAPTNERFTRLSALLLALFTQAELQAQLGEYRLATETIAQAEPAIAQVQTLAQSSADATLATLMREAVRLTTTRLFVLRGRIHEVFGREEEALESYLSALSALPGQSGLHLRVALLQSRANHHEAARANVNEALRVQAQERDQRGIVLALFTASRVALRAAQTAPAVQYAAQAQAAATRIRTPDLLAEANEVIADATAHDVAQKEFGLTAYHHALEGWRTLGQRPAQVRVLSHLAAALLRNGNKAEAETALLEAIKISEEIRLRLNDSEQEGGYLQRGGIAELYEQAVQLLLENNKPQAAREYASRARTRALTDVMQLAALKLNGAAGGALQASEQLSLRVQSLEAALANSSLPQSKRTRLQNQLVEANQAAAQARQQAQTARPDVVVATPPTRLASLQKSLTADEAVIEYFAAADRLYIFVVTTKQLQVRVAPLSFAALQKLIADARTLTDAFKKDWEDNRPEADVPRQNLWRDDGTKFFRERLAPLRQTLIRLHQSLVTPIEDLLANKQTLTVIPDGDLCYLPFAALVSPQTNRFLLERFALVYLTEDDVLQSSHNNNTKDLVIFSDPKLNLPGALQEAQQLRRLFPHARLYQQQHATKQKLFSLTSTRWLHLATHGLVMTDNLAESYLQMADARGVAEPDLSLSEIYNLPLANSDLIVLSACQTALGGGNPGPQFGVFIRAFRHATNSVVASLWSVSDDATGVMMPAFYRQLKIGGKKSMALRQAQLTVFRDPYFRHPYFWAAFGLYGQWK